MKRRKPDAQIVADSLALAEKKAAAGCAPCVTRLVSVAHDHGATADQITETAQRLVSRAALLKGSAAGLLTVAGAAWLSDLPALAARSAEAATAAGMGVFLSGSGRADVLAEALTDASIQRDLAALEALGYRHESRYDAACVSLAYTSAWFGAGDATHTAMVGWVRATATGQVRTAGVVITHPVQPPHPLTADWLRQHVYTSRVPSDVVPNDPTSCLNCVLPIIAGGCGFQAFVCIFSGPFVIACIEAACGYPAIGALITCIIGGQCP